MPSVLAQQSPHCCCLRPDEDQRIVVVEVVRGGRQLSGDVAVRPHVLEQPDRFRQEAARHNIARDAWVGGFLQRRRDVACDKLMRTHEESLPFLLLAPE